MRIVTYKTSFYSFYLPVACGLLVGGVRDDASLALARDICVRMGQYFQVPSSPSPPSAPFEPALPHSTRFLHPARNPPPPDLYAPPTPRLVIFSRRAICYSMNFSTGQHAWMTCMVQCCWSPSEM